MAEAAGHIVSLVKRHREIKAGDQLASSFPPYHLVRGMVPPTFRVGLLLFKYPWKCSQYAQRFVSQVILSPLKLSVKTDHHTKGMSFSALQMVGIILDLQKIL